jgi:hypothetical protein
LASPGKSSGERFRSCSKWLGGGDPDDAADPKLIEAADAHAKDLREAMALLDDAENLVAVLMASVEHEGDSRAMQAEAVLKIVRKKLRKAHVRIDRVVKWTT